jgi:hypothetical protein
LQRRISAQNVARHREAGQVFAQVGTQCLGIQGFAAIHGSTDLFAQTFVRHGIDRRLVHLGVLQERGFDHAATDVFTAADDQVFDAVNDVQKTVFFQVGHVPGAKPVSDEGLGADLGLLPVANEHRGAAHQQLTALAGGQFLAALVDDFQLQHLRAAA